MGGHLFDSRSRCSSVVVVVVARLVVVVITSFKEFGMDHTFESFGTRSPQCLQDLMCDINTSSRMSVVKLIETSLIRTHIFDYTQNWDFGFATKRNFFPYIGQTDFFRGCHNDSTGHSLSFLQILDGTNVFVGCTGWSIHNQIIQSICIAIPIHLR